MASAQFTINGTVPTTAVAVAESSASAFALLDSAGVRSVVWSVVASHASTATNPTITPAGSPLGATATVTLAAGSPQGFMIQCVIDGGVGVDGQPEASYTARAIIGVNNSSGYVPFVPGEELERSATHGMQFDADALQPTTDDGLTLGTLSKYFSYAALYRLRLNPYATAGVPTASAEVGTVIYVSDGDTGSPCLAVSNGAAWLRISLGTAISAT